MRRNFSRIFARLTHVPGSLQGAAYVAAPVPEMPHYFIGKSGDGSACLLLEVPKRTSRQRTPIRLENVEVQFDVRASIGCGSEVKEGVFAIVRCRSDNASIREYFLTTAEAIVAILGPGASELDISRALSRFAVIFQRLRQPPARTIAGLFGEVLIIHQGRDRAQVIRSWRVEESSRFDFALGDLRLDAKTTSGRLRMHAFSFDQCNPPPGTTAIVASLFLERLDTGTTLRMLIDEIEESIGSRHPDLVVKLRETVAETLGSSLSDGLNTGFDLSLARSSLRFFDLRDIPAIRGDLPPGVGAVQFQSDLSGSAGLAVRELERRDPALVCFLPR